MRTSLWATLVCLAGVAVGAELPSDRPQSTQSDPESTLNSAPHVERIVWQKNPIPLQLPVGRERLVRFPGMGPLKVGVPQKLESLLVSTPLDDSVYWRAQDAFTPALVIVEPLERAGPSITFYLEGVLDGVHANSVEVVTPSQDPTHTDHSSGHAAQGDGYIELTRFAAQQLYAPERLLTTLPGIQRVAVPDSAPVALMTGVGVDPFTLRARPADIEALPLIGWADAAGTHITAVRLRNQAPWAITLDPRTSLRGQWLAATLQHAQLAPAGQIGDTTAVYLISARDFKHALHPFAEADP